MDGVRHFQSFFFARGSNIYSYLSLKENYKSLSEENNILRNDNARLNEIIKNHIINNEDSTFSFSNDSAQYTYTQAKIIRNSVDNQHNYIIIDKGSDDGIEEDMGVITYNGIVGYVSAVGRNYSRVVSFLDINQNVSAIIKSSNTFGSLKWDGQHIDKAVLQDIPIHTIITKGDTVVTSGFSSTFPPNIPIGIIESSKMRDGINYQVTITLFENFRSLQNVYVVKNRDREEILSLSETNNGGKNE